MRRRESPSGYEAEQEAVVRVRRSACERVTERELLVGRLSLVSRLPQYLESRGTQGQRSVQMLFSTCSSEVFKKKGWADLTTAMLTGAVVLAR